eukprot:CAMPEP_0181139462 /NCGR_PEP_ID=MMETSP1071-20121207/34795_1 /TAXON_ID=35127 /ORGANISM="Thalassiosira sp., Strain NH16" /LENGTH=158 /DNA_ID=CAMNT_0023226371 /DNA_START=32 /DNA_END=504 /DNA_ORIENTATION=-
MYKKETRAIGQLLQKTMMKKFGPDLLNDHYYEFDIDDPNMPDLDFILVVGGFDSSNTAHLLEIPQMRGVTSFHINTASCIQADNTIRHRQVDGTVVDKSLFLDDGMIWTVDDDGEKTKKMLRVGVTSGASTPDKDVHDALGRIMMLNEILSTSKIEEG